MSSVSVTVLPCAQHRGNGRITFTPIRGDVKPIAGPTVFKAMIPAGTYRASYDDGVCSATFSLVVLPGHDRDIAIHPGSNMAYLSSGSGMLAGTLPFRGMSAMVLYCPSDCEWWAKFHPVPTVVDGQAYYAVGIPLHAKWRLRVTIAAPGSWIDLDVPHDDNAPLPRAVIRNVVPTDVLGRRTSSRWADPHD